MEFLKLLLLLAVGAGVVFVAGLIIKAIMGSWWK